MPFALVFGIRNCPTGLGGLAGNLPTYVVATPKQKTLKSIVVPMRKRAQMALVNNAWAGDYANKSSAVPPVERRPGEPVN